MVSDFYVRPKLVYAHEKRGNVTVSTVTVTDKFIVTEFDGYEDNELSGVYDTQEEAIKAAEAAFAAQEEAEQAWR